MKYYINKVEWRGSGYGPADGFFEYDNDHVVFMKFWKLLKQLSDWSLPKKDTAACNQLVRQLEVYTTNFSPNFVLFCVGPMDPKKLIHSHEGDDESRRISKEKHAKYMQDRI